MLKYAPGTPKRAKDGMAGPTIITLGCRLNAYESEVMRRNAGDAGLDDAIVINTCAVTAAAVSQATKTIRRLRRERPGARIIVTGCAAQLEPERFAALAEVDHVIGNAEKLRADTFTALTEIGSERVQVDDIMSVRETAGHLVDGFGTRARAFVQVQNGCDHRCTFCIIPFARGPSRSVPAGEVVRQIRHLVELGCGEIVLTGVDITAYGADLPGTATLGSLVRQILKQIPELQRLRLSSIDQVEADDELLRAFAEEERLMPHLHLSMQAGDDIVLKRMKRRHSRADAERFCADVRRLRSDVVFGADLIAGFPTETEAMFANSLSAIDDCGLTYLHVFAYSSRPGTPAARMPQVERNVVKERASILRAKGAAALSSYLEAQSGSEVEVLMENGGIGRTRQFAEVTLSPALSAGAMLRARVSGHDGHRLSGEVLT
jgi:threonylcarbamoyladenosine tRNA methylthiotransferase MtaB